MIPHDASPSFEALAVDVVDADPRTSEVPGRECLVTVQEPFDERVALIFFRTGPGTVLVEDIALMNRSDVARFRSAADRKARELLAHHSLA
ncbi:MAG: hypothetical protein U0R64_01935 [Candidatus Nanopelagicales bacterium]